MSDSRLVLLITSTFPFGQGEEFLEAEVRGLMEAGMNVILLPLWPRGSVRQGLSDLKYMTLSRTKISVKEFFKSFLNLINQDRKGIGRNRLFLIGRYFKESISAGYGPQLAKVISNLKISHIHAYWASGPAMLAMNASDLSGVHWSFSGHSGDLADGVNLDKKIGSSSGIRLISKRGNRILKDAGHAAESSVIIHLGVRVPILTETKKQLANFKIACVGNLIPIKNHNILIKAIELIKAKGINFGVDIIGSGPLENELKKSVEALNLEHSVVFRGQIDHAKLMSEFSKGNYQLVVLASGIAKSGQQEGIPVSLMEAMSYSIPVVSTETGGIAELVTKELDLLVPPSDPQALAIKILEIINMPASYRNEIANNCRSRIIEDFDSAKTSIQFEEWLNSLMS